MAKQPTKKTVEQGPPRSVLLMNTANLLDTALNRICEAQSEIYDTFSNTFGQQIQEIQKVVRAKAVEVRDEAQRWRMREQGEQINQRYSQAKPKKRVVFTFEPKGGV